MMRLYLHYKTGLEDEIKDFYTLCYALTHYSVDRITLKVDGKVKKIFVLDVEES